LYHDDITVTLLTSGNCSDIAAKSVR